MKSSRDIEKLFKDLHDTTNAEMDERVLRDVSQALEDSNRRNVWRIIMKSKITKLATAAAVILAVVLTITVLDKAVAPAYALEQTVEALSNVRFLHLVRCDEAGYLADERWIELGLDGKQVRYRQDTPPNFLAVEDSESTAVYHKDKNAVVLYDRKDKQYQWIGSLGLFLENLRQEGKIIEENADYKGQPAHRVLWPMMNAECYVNPETKLPIAIGSTKLSYEQPPPGVFEITIPEGFAVIDKRPGAAPTDEPDWLNDQQVADKYFRQARYALVSGDYGKATELFEYVVEKQPGRNWAWFWLGKTYYERGEYNLAVEKFSKVIEMMGGTYAFYARGLAYAQNDMEDASRKDLEKALPWMIRTLRQPTAAAMFEYADDPRLRDGGIRPTEQQILVRMINRLRIVTGQNFGYDPLASAEENEQAIAVWEDWFRSSGQIEFTPDAELIAVP